MKSNRFFGHFLLWRICLFLPLAVGFLFFSFRQGFEYTSILNWAPARFPLTHFLVYPWANFDGVRYLSIAGHGYITEAAFFPLFPIAIRTMAIIFGTGTAFGWQQFLSGFLLSNILFLYALYYLVKLLAMDYQEKIIGSFVLFLLFFPTAFFFGAIYSESLFLLLIALTFYNARRKNWNSSIFWGLLATLTRPVGLFILPALAWELLIQKSTFRFRLNWEETRISLLKIVQTVSASYLDFAKLLILLIGPLIYSYFNFNKWGDALYFINQHATLGNSRSVDSLVNPARTVYRYLKIGLSSDIFVYEWWIAMFELSIFFFVSFLLYKALITRIRASYLVFTFLAFMAPIFSGTFSGLPRYVIVLFPLFIVLAGIKNHRLKAMLMVLFAMLQFILLMYFSRGFYVS